MRARNPRTAAILGATFVLIGALWGGFLGWRQVIGAGSFLDRIEYLTVDWRFALRGPQHPPRGVVIAAIDEATIQEAGGFPLPRSMVARILRELAKQGPQALALDMLFVDAKGEGDAELSDALRATRSVVAAVGVFNEEEASIGRSASELLSFVPEPSRIVWPIPPIADFVRAGLVNISTDHAGVPRYISALYRTGNGVFPSFALAACSAALNTEPTFGDGTLSLLLRTLRTDLGYHLPISYYGPRGTIRQFSAVRALRGDVDPEQVKGQLVVLGATGLGLGDTFATPFDRMTPGVEVLATAISNMLGADGLQKTRFIRILDAAAAILLPVITVVLMAMPRPVLGFAFAGLVIIGWSALTAVSFAHGFWLSAAIPLAALVPVAGSYGVLRVVVERAAVRRLQSERAALAKFQSPAMAEYIVKHPRFLEKPVHQNVGVVFFDLSGFTQVSETLGPHWARELLVHLHAIVERDVVAHGGYVVSFMGDGAMTLFGLPQPSPTNAAQALRAAIHLRESLGSWLNGLPPIARQLSVRVSAHYGEAVVSRLGPAHHQHITATGDTVNLTSRLLEVAKQEGASLVISEALYAAAGAPDVPGTDTSPHEVQIRGHREPLRIRAWRSPAGR
jgi:adenylate cyclase